MTDGVTKAVDETATPVVSGSVHAGRDAGNWRVVVGDVAVAVAVVGGAWLLALRTNLPNGVATLWLGGGLLVAVLVMVPPRRWAPAVVISTAAWFSYFLSFGWSMEASALRAGAEIAAVVMVAVGVRRGGCLPVTRVNDVVGLTALAGAAGAVRVASAYIAGWVDPAVEAALHGAIGSIFLNSLVGVLVVAPFGVALVSRSQPWFLTSRQPAWTLGLSAVVVLFGVLLVMEPTADWWPGAEFLVFPAAIAAALTLPSRPLAVWLMAVTVLGAWAVVAGVGPFFGDVGEAPLLTDTFRAQALFIVLAMTVLTLYVLRDSWGRTSRDLDQATTRLNAVVEQAAVPMAFGPLIGGPLEGNQAMASFFHVSPGQLASLDWLALTHPDDAAEEVRLIEGVIRGESDGFRRLKRYILSDGTLKWGDVTVVRIEDDSSDQPWGVAQVVDMTPEMTVRQELERSENRFRTVVHKSSIPMSFGPLENGLAEVNDARCAFHERSREELQRTGWRHLLHPDDLEAMGPLHEAIVSGKIDHYRVLQRFIMPDGRLKWGDVSVARVDLDQTGDDFVVVQIVDVTNEVEARERLQHLVDTDTISGLGSRSWVTGMLERSLQQAAGESGSVAAMFIDLSEYGIITRTLGFEAGDEALARVAAAVASALPEDYLVGRFWGDRLLAIAPTITDTSRIGEQADRVLQAISAEIDVGGSRFSRTGSIGIAIASPASTVTSMLRSADHALATSLDTGRSRWHLVVDNEATDNDSGHIQREHDLREALDARQFVLHYQPQVRLTDGQVCGHEALVRWQHPERGLLSPGEFMDLMETSGLIIELGRQVLAQTCRDIAGHPDLPGPVSVNVSAIEVTEPDWITYVESTLREFNVPAEKITIELTETTLLRLTPDAKSALATIRDLGMGLHIDDFGMGFASIGSLLQVPLTGLKLDRVFVSALSNATQEQQDLVGSIASMAKGLRLEPIAEGIETAQQAELLRQAGWVIGQGYYFGKPAPLPR